MKKIFILLLLLVVFTGMNAAATGTKKKRPQPEDYGKVIIDNYSDKAELPAVVFDHWLHRSNFTCRLCHVDIGFAMKAGGTGIRAADNMKGYYCGTCHNGKMMFNNKKIFEACSRKLSDDDNKQCNRCHSLGMHVKRDFEFAKFTEKFPKERFGNGIDWEKAEAEGRVSLVDFIEGVSIKRKPLAIQKDFNLTAKVSGMPEIVFSHKKHTVWSGCELCHPEIFVGVKKGMTKYSMVEIFDGKYCGVCHGQVAFPLLDCQRCHTKPVQ